MKCNWKKLASEAVASLSPNEREESIVYIEQRIIPAGEELPWAGIQQNFDEPVAIAFVDLEPKLNWTHHGRYLVLDTQGIVLKMFDVDRPPFLTQVSPFLRVIHRGGQAPEWAIVTSALIE